jgi:hypothetical protein
VRQRKWHLQQQHAGKKALALTVDTGVQSHECYPEPPPFEPGQEERLRGG